MSDGVPEPPALDPAELAGRTFGRSRKGFEQAEVGAALGLAADALRLWQERDERLRARIDQLEAALEAVRVLDDDRVAALLGDDAVDAVLAAREAADEIRRRAEADAAEAAAHLRAELDAEAELARSETEQLRAEVLKAAEAELASARRRGREMVGEARAVRERMLRDLAERRRTARQQIAAAQAGRDHVLEALRAAGVAVDGATLNLGSIDPAVARAAERAALSVEDDIDRFVDALRSRLGDTDPADRGELAEVTVLEVVEDPAGTAPPEAAGPPAAAGPGADVDAAPGPGPAAAGASGAPAGPAADRLDEEPLADVPAPADDDVVVELVVPDDDEDDELEDDGPDGPEVVGDLALAAPSSELAAARRTVGADAEVIEFATAVRRPASYFVDDELDDDLDDDDLDDDYDDFEFDDGTEDESAPLSVVEGTSDDAAAAAATVHDLITRMRESSGQPDAPSADDLPAPSD